MLNKITHVTGTHISCDLLLYAAPELDLVTSTMFLMLYTSLLVQLTDCNFHNLVFFICNDNF